MMTQRENLLALIEKLPDEKLLDASFAIEQLASANADWRKRLQEEYEEMCRRMVSSLENVPTPAGSRPASNAGASWQTDENGMVLNPVFAVHWYEEERTTLVQQMKWMFGEQGFLVLVRTRLAEDSGAYVCSLQIGGPGRSVAYEERFEVPPSAAPGD